MISEVERESPITLTAKILDKLYAEEHSVGDRMVAFVVNPNLESRPGLVENICNFC
jgi:hypothetical protein